MQPSSADATHTTDPAHKPATAARIYDYLLGGTHNFPADRTVANQIIEQFPNAAAATRANRAFLGRGVRYLTSVGVRHFLDIGSGIPTEGNVHEIAQAAAQDARVVYVDIDPVAVSDSQELLAGNPVATAIRADARAPQAILDHPAVRALLGPGQPVGLLMAALLHFVPDDREAYAIVGHLVSALPAGSYLLISHSASETFTASGVDEGHLREEYRQRTPTPAGSRTQEQVSRFFAGLDLVEPGVVWTPQWRPDPEQDGAELGTDPTRSGLWCGVAHKP